MSLAFLIGHLIQGIALPGVRAWELEFTFNQFFSESFVCRKLTFVTGKPLTVPFRSLHVWVLSIVNLLHAKCVRLSLRVWDCGVLLFH